jgi:prevent-host-death family protein
MKLLNGSSVKGHDKPGAPPPAPHFVRRVEDGEEITITVAGRPGARLVPAAPRTWRRWADVRELFAGPADPAWDTDREAIAHEIQDPWAAR